LSIENNLQEGRIVKPTYIRAWGYQNGEVESIGLGIASNEMADTAGYHPARSAIDRGKTLCYILPLVKLIVNANFQ